MSTTDCSRYYWSFHFKSAENGLQDILSVININFSQTLIHLENALEYLPICHFTVEMSLHFYFYFYFLNKALRISGLVLYIASFHHFITLDYIRNLKFYNNMIFSRLPYPCYQMQTFTFYHPIKGQL